MQNENVIDNYLEKILEVNKTTNLTRITSKEDALILHVEDSLIALPELQAAPDGLYGDLGSGGGFPGVPLALATGRKTILVDSVQKKMKLVEVILTELKLNELITTYPGRIEDLAHEFPQKFSVLTARALAKLSILMELASPLLEKQGCLVCYKANIEEEEWNHALELQDKFGMELSSDRTLTLSDGETVRRIVSFKKVARPKVKLPRRVGQAQKNPF